MEIGYYKNHKHRENKSWRLTVGPKAYCRRDFQGSGKIKVAKDKGTKKQEFLEESKILLMLVKFTDHERPLHHPKGPRLRIWRGFIDELDTYQIPDQALN